MPAPIPTARVKPRSTRTSPCPLWSRNQPATGRSSTNAGMMMIAQGDGHFPSARTRNATAKMSWRIRTPMAVRPASESDSSVRSSAWTANTVLENERAKPTKAAVAGSRSRASGIPRAPIARSSAPTAPVATAANTVADAQTDGRASVFGRSFSPIPKRSSRIPSSETTSIASVTS